MSDHLICVPPFSKLRFLKARYPRIFCTMLLYFLKSLLTLFPTDTLTCTRYLAVLIFPFSPSSPPGTTEVTRYFIAMHLLCYYNVLRCLRLWETLVYVRSVCLYQDKPPQEGIMWVGKFDAYSMMYGCNDKVSHICGVCGCRLPRLPFVLVIWEIRGCITHNELCEKRKGRRLIPCSASISAYASAMRCAH